MLTTGPLAAGTTGQAGVGGLRSDSRTRPYISVVSPVYMAEHILPVLCQRLQESLSAITDRYEIILVCDGSPDNSWSVMEDLAREHPQIIAVNLSRNFGQHYALTAGMDLSTGEWTIIMDCDLQDQPEEIPRLLEKAKQGNDIVLARRIDRQHKLWKRAASALFFKAFSVLSGYKMDSAVGSFRIMHRKVVDAYCSMRETYRLFAGLVEWVGFKTAYVDVKHAPRYEGKSTYNLARMMKMAIDGMISFSNRPLYISIAIGVLISIVAGFYGAWLIVGYLISPTVGVAGWLSTITATAFLGGLILMNQGVLGIYLGRIYNQTKRRPLYIVDKIVMGADRTAYSSQRQ